MTRNEKSHEEEVGEMPYAAMLEIVVVVVAGKVGEKLFKIIFK